MAHIGITEEAVGLLSGEHNDSTLGRELILRNDCYDNPEIVTILAALQKAQNPNELSLCIYLAEIETFYLVECYTGQFYLVVTGGRIRSTAHLLSESLSLSIHSALGGSDEDQKPGEKIITVDRSIGMALINQLDNYDFLDNDGGVELNEAMAPIQMLRLILLGVTIISIRDDALQYLELSVSEFLSSSVTRANTTAVSEWVDWDVGEDSTLLRHGIPTMEPIIITRSTRMAHLAASHGMRIQIDDMDLMPLLEMQDGYGQTVADYLLNYHTLALTYASPLGYSDDQLDPSLRKQCCIIKSALEDESEAHKAVMIDFLSIVNGKGDCIAGRIVVGADYDTVKSIGYYLADTVVATRPYNGETVAHLLAADIRYIDLLNLRNASTLRIGCDSPTRWTVAHALVSRNDVLIQPKYLPDVTSTDGHTPWDILSMKMDPLPGRVTILTLQKAELGLWQWDGGSITEEDLLKWGEGFVPVYYASGDNNLPLNHKPGLGALCAVVRDIEFQLNESKTVMTVHGLLARFGAAREEINHSQYRAGGYDIQIPDDGPVSNSLMQLVFTVVGDAVRPESTLRRSNTTPPQLKDIVLYACRIPLVETERPVIVPQPDLT